MSSEPLVAQEHKHTTISGMIKGSIPLGERKSLIFSFSRIAKEQGEKSFVRYNTRDSIS